MKLARKIVSLRVPILVLTLLMLIPAVFGMAATRINYDMLTYLPEDMETVVGQDELMKDFGKGAFSLIIVEDMEPEAVSRLRRSIEGVDHEDSVIWYDSIADVQIENGKLVSDGTRTLALGYALPGMQESLSLPEELKLTIPDHVTLRPT